MAVDRKALAANIGNDPMAKAGLEALSEKELSVVLKAFALKALGSDLSVAEIGNSIASMEQDQLNNKLVQSVVKSFESKATFSVLGNIMKLSS